MSKTSYIVCDSKTSYIVCDREQIQKILFRHPDISMVDSLKAAIVANLPEEMSEKDMASLIDNPGTDQAIIQAINEIAQSMQSTHEFPDRVSFEINLGTLKMTLRQRSTPCRRINNPCRRTVSTTQRVRITGTPGEMKLTELSSMYLERTQIGCTVRELMEWNDVKYDATYAVLARLIKAGYVRSVTEQIVKGVPGQRGRYWITDDGQDALDEYLHERSECGLFGSSREINLHDKSSK